MKEKLLLANYFCFYKYPKKDSKFLTDTVFLNLTVRTESREKTLQITCLETQASEKRNQEID